MLILLTITWLTSGCGDNNDGLVEETDSQDTVQGESDSPDTPVDTQPDTPQDTPVDTPTDTPVDTAVSPAPPDLGPGFLNLTARLPPTPRVVEDGSTRGRPDLTHGLFADVDGDGAVEVLLTGLRERIDVEPTVIVYRFEPGTETLVEDPALSARFVGQDPNLAGLVDLDGDGRLDLISSSEEQLPTWGIPDGFSTPLLGMRDYEPGFVIAAVADIDHDGLLDLLFDGGCRRDLQQVNFTLSQGGRRWQLRRDLLDSSPRANSYAVGLMPWLGADMLFGLGAPCSRLEPGAGFYVVDSVDEFGLPHFIGHDPVPADSLWKLSPAVNGGPLAMINPMGASIVDRDNDGDLDLIVATAWTNIVVLHNTLSPMFSDDSVPAGMVLPQRGVPNQEETKPWGIAAIDLTRDGVIDVIAVGGQDASDYRDGVPLSDHTTLFTDHMGQTWDIGAAVGVDVSANGRSLTVGDLDRDGRPDLIIGGQGLWPQVLLNRTTAARPGVAVALAGAPSGTGTGAVVRFEVDGVLGPAMMMGGIYSPGPFSEPLLFGAAGTDGILDAVHVAWPDGYTQIVRDLPASRVHTIQEPPILAITPATRRLPADGSSTATVVVAPHDVDGLPYVANQVEVSAWRGGATIGAPIRVGDHWEVSVTAPDAPGVVRLQIVVDGAPWLVKPAIWFE
jgi:hypothetical protein